MAAVVPALLVLVLAAWGGTLIGGATWWGALGAQAALLAALVWLGRGSPDPLRLGRIGRLVPVALLAFALVSLLASPVPRAGRVGLVLLPALLWLPEAVAGAWRHPTARQRGLRALSAVVFAVAAAALLEAVVAGGRAQSPLGHHNLVAAWMVILGPLALLAGREGLPRGTDGKRGARFWRLFGLATGLLALAAVVASRSLAGAVAVVLQAVALGWRRRRARPWLVAVALLLLVSQGHRLGALLAGADPSKGARQLYWQAAWQGASARPLIGWGPGSTPWLLAEHLRAVPGVTPASAAVGHAHSLPLQIAFELGLPGLVLAASVVGLFAIRHWPASRRPPTGGDSEAGDELGWAALLGLLGGAVTALTDVWTWALALPVAWAVAGGALLAAEAPSASAPRAAGRALIWVWGLVALALLAPIDLAHRAYDLAGRAATVEAAESGLRSAVRLDPSFPLYRARLAIYAGEPDERARQASAAAAGARGSALFWLLAGELSAAAGDDAAAAEALGRARSLDPLGAVAPLLEADLLGARAAVDCAARALLADPRLLEAPLWLDRPRLLETALARVERWAGVNPGWRLALLAEAVGRPSGGALGEGLAFGLEPPDRSLELHLFRRLPWSVEWLRVPLFPAYAEIDLPAATALPTSLERAFPRDACSPPG